MSDIVSSSEQPRGENNLLGKHKWRGKFLSVDSRFGRAAKNPESTNDDIANFLHTSALKPEAGPRSAPLIPRVDVAASSKQPATSNSDHDDIIVDVYRRPKPRQNKGLSVRFESAPPVVIGVGGDEAELPSRDVSRSFAGALRSERSPSQEQLNYNVSDQHREVYGRLPDQYDETAFQALSPQRSTSVDDELPVEKPYRASHDREAVQSGFTRIQESPSQSQDEQHNLYPSLRKREVRNALHTPSMAEREESLQSYNRRTAETRNRGATRHSEAPLPEDLPFKALSLRSESPEPPYIFQEASPSIRYLPSATRDPQKFPDAELQGIHRRSQDASQAKNKPIPLLSEAISLEDESLEDFDSRVRRFNNLFQLNASAHIDIMMVPFERWVRTSAWWFLRGRGGLESAVRAEASTFAPANAANDSELSMSLKQAYFSLAKAWWILKDVTPNLPALKRFGISSKSSTVSMIRNSGDGYLAELYEAHLTIAANMPALTMSMRRNGRLPPDHLQMQRLECQIFLESPNLPSEIAALTVNNILDPTRIKGKRCIANPFFPVLVGDTSRHFNFCRTFVDVVLKYGDDAESKVPCMLSILRERTDWAVKAAVASQDGQVNFVIQSSEDDGLDWRGVQWKIPLNMMQLQIAEGVCLQIKLSEKDFKTIWGICDYTQRIRKEYLARKGEEVIYERELLRVQCFDSPSFPAEPVQNCRIRLFKRTIIATDNGSQQEVLASHRLMVITPSTTKTLSQMNCQLGKDNPIFFGTHRSKGGDTLLIRVPSSLRVSLTFHEPSDVDLFRSILSGTLITQEDDCSASLKLQDFTISPVSANQEVAYVNASRCFDDLRWHKVRVVNRRPSTHGQDSQSILRSDHLRILTDCDFGTFTDRVNNTPGELQLNLSIEDMTTIKLLRAAQQDMTWGFADGVLGEPALSSLSYIIHSMSTSSSVMTYQFRSLPDLHSFQAMLTGFHVLYDGLASTFSISRRRTVVPMHKHWEASTPRLQIVKQDKTVQLVVFFKDFSHGTCMNFVLKVTDSFETFARSGVSFLRIVDAKFSLPKDESNPARDFVCLDMPDFPSEHDDIVIGFDKEKGECLRRLIGSRAKESRTDKATDRDKFANELPAPVNKMSRMMSLRR